ncbi:hypothetical protein J6590_021733 [Homalodisca vitripennis]|nr:hypothetical protein J6590_021733 [Homalodisca vitripennis]
MRSVRCNLSPGPRLPENIGLLQQKSDPGRPYDSEKNKYEDIPSFKQIFDEISEIMVLVKKVGKLVGERLRKQLWAAENAGKWPGPIPGSREFRVLKTGYIIQDIVTNFSETSGFDYYAQPPVNTIT